MTTVLAVAAPAVVTAAALLFRAHPANRAGMWPRLVAVYDADSGGAR